MALLAVNPERRQTRRSREIGTGLPRQAQATCHQAGSPRGHPGARLSQRFTELSSGFCDYGKETLDANTRSNAGEQCRSVLCPRKLSWTLTWLVGVGR